MALRRAAACVTQDYLVKTILEGIPPLGERVKLLRERELARRGAAVENDIKSQSECVPLREGTRLGVPHAALALTRHAHCAGMCGA